MKNYIEGRSNEPFSVVRSTFKWIVLDAQTELWELPVLGDIRIYMSEMNCMGRTVTVRHF